MVIEFEKCPELEFGLRSIPGKMLIEETQHEIQTATVSSIRLNMRVTMSSRCSSAGSHGRVRHQTVSDRFRPKPPMIWQTLSLTAYHHRKLPEYPNAKWPGVVVWSEIVSFEMVGPPHLALVSELTSITLICQYNVTGPVRRFANSIASQGYIVACPTVFHEFEGSAAVLSYDTTGTDNGNAYKVKKLLSAYDEDATKSIDLLQEHPNCNGRIATTGMCLGGHLAFRVRPEVDVLQHVLMSAAHVRLLWTLAS